MQLAPQSFAHARLVLTRNTMLMSKEDVETLLVCCGRTVNEDDHVHMSLKSGGRQGVLPRKPDAGSDCLLNQACVV